MPALPVGTPHHLICPSSLSPAQRGAGGCGVRPEEAGQAPDPHSTAPIGHPAPILCQEVSVQGGVLGLHLWAVCGTQAYLGMTHRRRAGGGQVPGGSGSCWPIAVQVAGPGATDPASCFPSVAFPCWVPFSPPGHGGRDGWDPRLRNSRLEAWHKQEAFSSGQGTGHPAPGDVPLATGRAHGSLLLRSSDHEAVSSLKGLFVGLPNRCQCAVGVHTDASLPERPGRAPRPPPPCCTRGARVTSVRAESGAGSVQRWLLASQGVE